MKEVDFSTFGIEVLEESFYQLVVVDFWAPWCSPCLSLMATIEKVESDNLFPVKFAKVNVDEHTDLALHYKVMGVPNVKFFFGGKIMDDFSENISAPVLKAMIQKNLLLAGILKRLKIEESVINSARIAVEDFYKQNSTRATPFLIVLIKYYLTNDIDKAQSFVNELNGDPECIEDHLYFRDLLQLLKLGFEENPVHKKLWAAKNSFLRKDFDATYQFLLQAHKINSGYMDQLPKMAMLAFQYYLGNHPLNDKYSTQINNLSD